MTHSKLRIKHIIVLLIFTLASTYSYSQTKDLDKVILKTGEEYTGTVVEQKPGQYILILLEESQDTVQVDLKSIDRMVKILATETGQIQMEEPIDYFNQRPFYSHISGSMGGGDFSVVSFGMAIMHTVGPRVQAGIAAQYLSENTHESSSCFGSPCTRRTSRAKFQNSIPVTAEFRYALQKSKRGRSALMLNMSAGYNFILNDTYFEGITQSGAYSTDGLYLQPSLGYRFNFGANVGLLFDISYQHMSLNRYEQENDMFIKKAAERNIVARASLFF